MAESHNFFSARKERDYLLIASPITSSKPYIISSLPVAPSTGINSCPLAPFAMARIGLNVIGSARNVNNVHGLSKLRYGKHRNAIAMIAM